MMYLLDTSTFSWMLLEPDVLGRTARAAVEEQDSKLFLSAASCFEIATKVRLGKWRLMATIESRMSEVLSEARIELLAISGDVALLAGRLPQKHKDPFDRIIAAQALQAEIPVISPDREFDTFGVRRIW